MEEVFEKNESAYNTNRFYPQISGEIIETGYVREQKVVRIALYPVRYNPVQKKIKVIPNFQVSLGFVNPSSPVNKELGIFRNMMHHAALNYELKGMSASKIEPGVLEEKGLGKTAMVTAGSVTRVTNLDLLTGPSAMPVDYLIITHADLFNSSYLTQLANHRKDYNKFDVVIVQVDASGSNNDIYDYYYDPYDPEKPNYEMIRDFIADVYDNGKANHTYDGRLGYFVLVGDAYKDDNSTEMIPANGYYTSYTAAGDYYYACSDGDADVLLDLMYGRISVGNDNELANVVNKITAYEQSTSGSWRDNITFLGTCPWFFKDYDSDYKFKQMAQIIPQSYNISYAWRGFAADTAQTHGRPNFTHHTEDDTSIVIVPDEVDDMWSYIFTGWRWGYYPNYEYGGQYDDPSDYCGMILLKDWVYDQKLNTAGQFILIYQGHGGIFEWGNEGTGRNFRTDEIINRLTITDKYPFIINCGCSTGMFDNKDEIDSFREGNYTDCISEVAVNEADKGAIACLSSTRDSFTNAFGKVDKYVLEAAFEDMSHVMGEAVMESKIKLGSGYWGLMFKRQYNLYGDPALNLWPYGFSGTEDITLSGTVNISTNLDIKSGTTLTILPGTIIVFDGYRSIHVRQGAKIIAEGTESNPILFTSETGNSPQSWKNIFVHGSHNRFKWCEFEYGNWAIKFTGKDNPTVDNIVEHCTFHDNDQAIRIHKNEAVISDCHIYDNRHALVCYSNAEIEFDGNHIYDNARDGIYSWSGNKLWLHWNLIENNGNGSSSTRNGIYTYSSDVVWLCEYKQSEKNTVRDNHQNEIYAYAGDPFVCVGYPWTGDQNAVYDTDGAGDSYYEAKNYSGNSDCIYACFCWWGDDITPQVSGDVLTDYKLTSEPDWLGSTGGGSKIIGPKDTETILAPQLSIINSTGTGKSSGNDFRYGTDDIEEKITELEKTITKNPRSSEAKKALNQLYAIVRSDFTENTLKRKQSFYSFLKNIFENNKNSKIGSLALQKMIIWKQLQNDNRTAIKLSEQGLKILTKEDRMVVLENLVMLYIENGDLGIAKKYLKECKEKYSFDKAGIEFLEEELVDVSEEISNRNIAKGKQEQASQDSTEEDLVKELTLEQNYPNPGNPATTIHYHLPQSGQVTLKIINILGQEIKTLVDTKKEAGSYTVIWDGTNNQDNQVTSGIYLYLLQTQNKVITKKMLLMK